MFWSPPTLCTLLGEFVYIPSLPPCLTLSIPLQRHCESQGCSITDAIRGQRTALGGLNQLILFSLISAFYNPHKDNTPLERPQTVYHRFSCHPPTTWQLELKEVGSRNTKFSWFECSKNSPLGVFQINNSTLI